MSGITQRKRLKSRYCISLADSQIYHSREEIKMTRKVYMQIEEMLELVRKAVEYMQDLSEEEYNRMSCGLKEES